MREVTADPGITATLTDRNLTGCPVNLALTRTQSAVSQLVQRLLNPTGELARLKETEIARPELVASVNRNAHTPLCEILEQFRIDVCLQRFS